MEDDHILIDQYCNKNKSCYFAIYDGHGGRKVVDFVVCSLHENLKNYLKLNPNISMLNALKAAYEITDKQIHRQAIFDCGATSVSIIIDNNVCYIANCGDARAVLCRNGRAIRLTKDHKASDLSEKLLIEQHGGSVSHQQRVNNILAVTRAFGDHFLKPPLIVEPYLDEINIMEDQDQFILLACDGIWDVIDDQTACNYIIHHLCESSNVQSFEHITITHLKQHLQSVLNNMIQYAISKGSKDNISVMLVAL